MPDPLVEKLEQFERLSEQDVKALAALTTSVKSYPKRTDILREGDPCGSLYLLRKGWACRYVALPGDRRQIINFVIPGDLCNVHVMLFKKMEHRIRTLTQCEIGLIPTQAFIETLGTHPRIARALFWSGLVTEAVLRERIISLGRRSAAQRVAHLFCDLLVRLKAAGLAQDSSYDLPLTQIEIADTLGLNHVHVNRIVTTMRKTGVIRLEGHKLEVRNWESLTALGEFDPRLLTASIAEEPDEGAP